MPNYLRLENEIRGRRDALTEVIAMVEAYRETKPKANETNGSGTPAQREHAAFERGARMGERSALYSVICRLQSMLKDPST